ncbi:hypothetical protein [Vibrio sp. 99-70-13A1]|uniref:hypothetical protein n=1 Tax=Vibrio sp. 99-70-13A1 TaxID=2607601 RepID=UPI0014932E16|nr:hypothetical protein [Vibrio sp. 99-70-13A1]NOH96101.1 hypothetical protein [Vibrio sp. 99-70-13A1]
MNLFLVTSPFQLLCAIEAKSQYSAVNNILVLREEKSLTSAAQMKLLLNKSEWDHILYLGRKSKIWEAWKLQYNLKKINPSLQFNSVFYADYSAWRTNVMLNNLATDKEIMFDDGVGTIREFKDKIKPELVVSRNKTSRDVMLKLVGLKPPRKIFPRDNFSFFTFFELAGSKQPVTTNNLQQLQTRLNTSRCYSQEAPIAFIGQGMVAEKGINLDYYANMLESLVKDNDAELIYFPHRTEAEFVKERLMKIEGLTYHQSTLPLELEVAVEGITLSKIYGIASTAAVTLEKLYPEIPIVDLKVPVKHYLIEEFGDNFHTVANELNLNSINLE